MTTLSAERILTAMAERERVTRWIAPNAILLNVPDVEGAFLRALSGPVPDDYVNSGVPLLRYADGSVATLLLDALLDPPTSGPADHSPDVVDYPGLRWTETIWIPCGTSVVELRFASWRRRELDDLFANERGTATALAWW